MEKRQRRILFPVLPVLSTPALSRYLSAGNARRSLMTERQ